MREIMSHWSLPWYFYLGFGVFLTLLVVKPAFRDGFYAFVARMLNMKPRKNQTRNENEDE